jgi:hypothetical protein
MDRIINIPLSKSKLYRIVVISLIFIVLGIGMFTKAGDIMNDNTVKKYIVQIAGILVVLLCCFTLYYALKKLKNLEEGLSITDMGIYDNSSGINLGLLKWEDIKSFKEYDNRKGTKSLVVLVHNPQDYINRVNGFWAKKLLQANYKLAGTPIFISAVSLSINYEKLKEYVLEGFEKYNGKIIVK